MMGVLTTFNSRPHKRLESPIAWNSPVYRLLPDTEILLDDYSLRSHGRHCYLFFQKQFIARTLFFAANSYLSFINRKCQIHIFSVPCISPRGWTNDYIMANEVSQKVILRRLFFLIKGKWYQEIKMIFLLILFWYYNLRLCCIDLLWTSKYLKKNKKLILENLSASWNSLKPPNSVMLVMWGNGL